MADIQFTGTDEFHALWRSSAHEAVPYTDDFPEALLVLPELMDGSIGQGKATKITIQITLNGPKSNLRVSDNGMGVENERRLLQWAASKANDNLHRNGHGLKKCLTKWEPEYKKANWTIKYRRPGKNIQVIKGPFKGRDTDSDEDTKDGTTLYPSGTEISIDFDANKILESLSDKPTDLFNAIKELIQTRYSESILQNTEFGVNIINTSAKPDEKPLGLKSSRDDKKTWHSFKTCMESYIADGTIQNVFAQKISIPGGFYTLELFYIKVLGNTAFPLKKEFPKYGHKSMKSSRAHISLDGRMIEAIPIYQLMNREANHNDYNGFIAFVNFIPNSVNDAIQSMPAPCTTKVSLYENDPIFKKFKEDFYKTITPVIDEVLKNVEAAKAQAKPKAPVPAPVPAPAPPAAPAVLPALASTPVVYKDFFAFIQPKVKAINPTFTPQEITAEIARIWNQRKLLIAPAAPAPAPAPVPVPVPVPVPAHAPAPAAPAPAPRQIPVAPIVPVPQPQPQVDINFSKTDAHVIVLEKGKRFIEIRYRGQYHIAEKYYTEHLMALGPQRFKEWILAIEKINQLLQ
jgi:hypothetical protein